jgi:hypothetical protein
MSNKKLDLMIDLETLGTSPGCVVLSIAAVPFNTEFDLEPFYEKISVVTCQEYGLTTDPKTIEWWRRQSEEARNEAFSGTKELRAVLYRFSEYCAALPGAPRIWGNGSDFDNPILAAAYKAVDLRQPWDFRDNMCYRTLKNLFHFIPYTKPEVAHNAYQDARAQAVHAQLILNWLSAKGALPNAL